MLIWFILASISGQILNKISRALPRFARPCVIFWLQSPVEFILASISRQIQRKWLRALPRFAQQCGIFWLQSPAKFTTKSRELCLASLGHVFTLYFGSNFRPNSQQNFESSASLRSAMFIILASNSGKFIWASIAGQIQSGNSRASYSLRSAMRFKLATSPVKFVTSKNRTI